MRSSGLYLLLAISLPMATVRGVPITLLNPSFESDVLTDGQSRSYATVIAGWNRLDDPSRLWGTGTYNPFNRSPSYIYPGSNDNPSGGEL